MRRLAGYGAVALAALLVARVALAQDDPERFGSAQTIFERALELVNDKKFDEACPKLEEVVRMVPDGLGARLRLADCYEQSGKLASAWAAYLLAENLASRAGKAERATFAGERAAILRPKLSRVTVDVPAGLRAVPGLRVRRDGLEIRSAEWGLPVPVDAGRHTVEVTAPGKRTWETSFATDGTPAEKAVKAPERLEDVPAPPAKLPKLEAAPPAAAAEKSSQAPVWAWVAGGAGIASAVVSVGFAVDQQAAQGTIHAHCQKSACDRRDGFDPVASNDRLYRDYGLFIGFAAGGALLLGTAAYGFVSASGAAGKSAAPRALRPTAWASPSAGGLGVAGGF